MGREIWKKGQVAFEFLIIYIILLFFFLASFYIVMKDAFYSRMYAEMNFAKEVASRIATEINIASRFIGYEKTLNIPPMIMGSEYSLSVVGGSLYLSYQSFSPMNLYYPLEYKNVTNRKGDTVFEINVTKGWIKIKNENGKVIIDE